MLSFSNSVNIQPVYLTHYVPPVRKLSQKEKREGLWVYLCIRHARIKWQILSVQDITLNPCRTEFLKWNNPSYIFGTFHYHF